MYIGNGQNMRQRSKRELSDNVALELMDIVRAYRSYFAIKMAALNLDRSQWQLMINLWYFEGTTQQQLADMMGMTRGGMNKLIDRLEKSGFVRRADGHDRRSKRIFSVDSVRPMVAKIDNAQKAMVKASLAGMTSEEVTTLKLLLRKVRDGIGNLK